MLRYGPSYTTFHCNLLDSILNSSLFPGFVYVQLVPLQEDNMAFGRPTM